MAVETAAAADAPDPTCARANFSCGSARALFCTAPQRFRIFPARIFASPAFILCSALEGLGFHPRLW